MNSSHWMITWWPTVRYSVSIKAKQQGKRCLQRESCPPIFKELHSKKENVSSLIHLTQALNSIIIWHSHFKYYWVCWLRRLRWPSRVHRKVDIFADHFPFRDPFQIRSLSGDLIYEPEYHTQIRLWFFLDHWEQPGRTIIFHIRKRYLYNTPNHCVQKFFQVEVLEFWLHLFSMPWCALLTSPE